MKKDTKNNIIFTLIFVAGTLVGGGLSIIMNDTLSIIIGMAVMGFLGWFFMGEDEEMLAKHKYKMEVLAGLHDVVTEDANKNCLPRDRG